MRYIDIDMRMFRGANIVELSIQSYLEALNLSKKKYIIGHFYLFFLFHILCEIIENA
jgi:hypothetical protein